jgi:hypothetical protein
VEGSLAERRARTHAIVEGALLGDITIVFLMIGVYLPLLPIAAITQALGVIPLVLLMHRRGFGVTLMAMVASYILFSALVGPLLGLLAIDVGVAALLLGTGRLLGLGPVVNTLWTGVVYAVLDRIVPTLASVIIFRYPVKDLIRSSRNFIHLIFQFGTLVLTQAHQVGAIPLSAVHTWNSWRGPATDNWLAFWVALLVLSGVLTMYLAVLVTEIILGQLPENLLRRQEESA